MPEISANNVIGLNAGASGSTGFSATGGINVGKVDNSNFTPSPLPSAVHAPNSVLSPTGGIELNAHVDNSSLLHDSGTSILGLDSGHY